MSTFYCQVPPASLLFLLAISLWTRGKEMDSFRVVIYGLTFLFLGISALKDIAKTKLALNRALQSFSEFCPGFNHPVLNGDGTDLSPPIINRRTDR